eukprot:gene3756-7455_t
MSCVKVHVYDLSRGMATKMSMDILGQQIDGIWHLGTIPFSQVEYSFASKILPQQIFQRSYFLIQGAASAFSISYYSFNFNFCSASICALVCGGSSSTVLKTSKSSLLYFFQLVGALSPSNEWRTFSSAKETQRPDFNCAFVKALSPSYLL